MEGDYENHRQHIAFLVNATLDLPLREGEKKELMTYIYECSNCGRFELQQSIKDSPIEICPTCGSSVRRIITGGTGVIYKCGGFYSKPVHFNTDNVSEPKVID